MKKLTGKRARRAFDVLVSLSAEEPVVAIHGPRAVGKSLILQQFATNHDVDVLDLDNPEIRDAVRASPGQALAVPAPLCIDEYQLVPEVLDALKARLNREGSLPHTAVITGSTRHDALPMTAQTLTGRLHSMQLLPLSQGEIAEVHEDLIESLLADPAATLASMPVSRTTRASYAERVCAGGFPMALQRDDVSRARWFDNYVRSSIERDAAEITRIHHRQALMEVFDRLSAQTAQVLNMTNIASGQQIDRKTVESYVRLLEDLFLVWRLPAWGTTLASRVGHKAKLHLVDSGLAARKLQLTPSRLNQFNPSQSTQFGHLLETFVVGEIRKQLSWMHTPSEIGHWRRVNRDEVDLVVEFDDGRVLAFEIKAADRVQSRDLKGLASIRQLLGSRFVAGVVFTLGTRSYSVDESIHVMPVDRLWHTNGVV